MALTARAGEKRPMGAASQSKAFEIVGEIGDLAGPQGRTVADPGEVAPEDVPKLREGAPEEAARRARVHGKPAWPCGCQAFEVE